MSGEYGMSEWIAVGALGLVAVGIPLGMMAVSAILVRLSPNKERALRMRAVRFQLDQHAFNLISNIT
jgi:hypothetical protein